MRGTSQKMSVAFTFCSCNDVSIVNWSFFLTLSTVVWGWGKEPLNLTSDLQFKLFCQVSYSPLKLVLIGISFVELGLIPTTFDCFCCSVQMICLASSFLIYLCIFLIFWLFLYFSMFTVVDELYKLIQGLAICLKDPEKKYQDKVCALLSAWERLASCSTSSLSDDVLYLTEYLYRYSV